MLSDEDKDELRSHFYFFAKFFRSPTPPGTPKISCLYAFEMSDNTVKIGVSSKPEKRVKGIEHTVYLNAFPKLVSHRILLLQN